MGDASGVGPEILLRAFALGELGTDVVAVGDLAVLDLCNRRLHCDVTLEPVTTPRPSTPLASPIVMASGGVVIWRLGVEISQPGVRT